MSTLPIRYLARFIGEDLKNKMVFLGGPRQVGKTTLALGFLSPSMETNRAYFNWDSSEDRRSLIEEKLPSEEPLLVLDEIHKHRHWRNLVKGLYDKNKSTRSFLITGSARLDYYRRGGDSLQGRYHYYRLHPLSYGELLMGGENPDIERLLEFGGFPEPYLKANTRHWRRWQKERSSRVIGEDLITLERVQELSQLSLMIGALPSRVGSPLSIKAFSEDLQVAQKTAARWIAILENLYFCFRISAYGSPRIRAVKKEQKLYLWDWSLCEDEGARFENFLACQLLKYCHFEEDVNGHSMELRYLRDTDRREVDFVVIKDKQPLFAVECKLKDSDLSKHISYFKERTPIPKFYQVSANGKNYDKEDIRIRSVHSFVSELKLP